MTESTDYDDLYALLLRLCEQETVLSDQARLCVMEAFNNLSELHVPGRFSARTGFDTPHLLDRALTSADRLARRSERLDHTLVLMRVRGLVREALVGEP